MKILIFGAGGKIGSLVTTEALRRGHEVVGFYRKNESPDSNIKAVFGDATSVEDVNSAVKNCDVVISCLGHIKHGDPEIQTKAISLIIEAMQANNIKKIVSLTGSGARLSGDKTSILDLILNSGLKLVDPNRMSDGSKHITKLQESNLDWTVLRTLKHSDTKPSPRIRLTAGGPARLLSSRVQIAETMVNLAESNDWIKKAPVLS